MAEPRKKSTTGIMRRLSARVHRPDPNKMSLRAEHVVLDSDDEATSASCATSTSTWQTTFQQRLQLRAAAFIAVGIGSAFVDDGVEIGADEAEQLRILDKGRALVRQIMERLPQVEEKGNAHESKGGVVVHREHGGHLSVSILPHPDSLGVARWDLYMVDNWHVDLVLRGNSLATGLLPLLAMFREPDLVADYLRVRRGCRTSSRCNSRRCLPTTTGSTTASSRPLAPSPAPTTSTDSLRLICSMSLRAA